MPRESPDGCRLSLLTKSRYPVSFQPMIATVVAIAPGDSMAQNNYGTFLCRNNRLKEAEGHFKKAIADPLYKKIILGTPGAEDDTLDGGAGSDIIYGGGGNDVIKGQTGPDEIRGGGDNGHTGGRGRRNPRSTGHRPRRSDPRFHNV